MHELAITENIISIAEENARKNGASTVSAIDLVIGELTNIVDDSIQFYFDLIAKGTMAEGAELRFKRIRAKVECTDCGKHYCPDENDYSCPECGQMSLSFIEGNEFFIESITAS